MDNNLENNDWKTEAPLLGSLPVRNPFSVPEGYFEDLSDKISSSVYLENLKIKIKEAGFTAPENYFNELSEDINSEIVTERIKAAIPNKGYTVPVNYFDHLQSKILNRTTKAVRQTKIIRLWHSNLLKYTSAACFLILSATGFYFHQQQGSGQKTVYDDLDTEQMLYDIDEQVIIDHIQANNLQQIKPSSAEAELEDYILNNYSQSDIASDL